MSLAGELPFPAGSKLSCLSPERITKSRTADAPDNIVSGSVSCRPVLSNPVWLCRPEE